MFALCLEKEMPARESKLPWDISITLYFDCGGHYLINTSELNMENQWVILHKLYLYE